MRLSSSFQLASCVEKCRHMEEAELIRIVGTPTLQSAHQEECIGFFLIVKTGS